MRRFGKLGCLGCGGAGLFFLGFALASVLIGRAPHELGAATSELTKALRPVRELERPHETEPGWTVREEVGARGVRHGRYTVWEGETLLLEGAYEHGRREGPWRSWHPNGLRAQEIHYLRDRAEGPYRHWHENGRLAAAGAFEHDEPAGPWVYHDPRGRLDRERTGFYAAGQRVRALTKDELEAAGE